MKHNCHYCGEVVCNACSKQRRHIQHLETHQNHNHNHNQAHAHGADRKNVRSSDDDFNIKLNADRKHNASSNNGNVEDPERVCDTCAGKLREFRKMRSIGGSSFKGLKDNKKCLIC